MVQLNLSKEESLKMLDLRKQNVVQLCLTKPTLVDQPARVAVVMDYSGSMSTLFRNGTVQSILERLLPIAMQFDDNGEMEVWLFENSFRRMPNMTLDNFYGYVQREILDKGYRMGGTYYAPVMRDVYNKYINEEPANLPNYVIFITDGANSDRSATQSVITEVSKYPIFWQFVGIGDSEFPFLEKLDDLTGRYVDNADFFALNDFQAISDDELYRRLLTEYPGWLGNPALPAMSFSGPRMDENTGSTSRQSTTTTTQAPPKKKGFFGLF